jgi:hypothetical protein
MSLRRVGLYKKGISKKMKAKARRTHKRVARVTEGSGNVFADLGLPNPEQELLKAQLRAT